MENLVAQVVFVFQCQNDVTVQQTVVTISMKSIVIWLLLTNNFTGKNFLQSKEMAAKLGSK